MPNLASYQRGFGNRKPGPWARPDSSYWTGKFAGCWLFNEAGGPTAHDISGNNNTGSFVGASAWGTSGISLNGGTYINVPNSPSLQLTNLTVGIRFFANSLPGSGNSFPQLIQKGTSSTIAANSYGLGANTSVGNKFELQLGNGTTFTQVTAGTTFTTGKWYFLVGTVNGANAAIYTNGILDGSTSSAVTPQIITAPLLIGAGTITPAFWFDGLVDFAFVLPFALNASQVFDLYQRPYEFITQPQPRASYSIPQQSGLLAAGPAITLAKKPGPWARLDHAHWAGNPDGCWLFNEAGGSIARDISRYANAGTLSSSAQFVNSGVQFTAIYGMVQAPDLPIYQQANIFSIGARIIPSASNDGNFHFIAGKHTLGATLPDGSYKLYITQTGKLGLYNGNAAGFAIQGNTTLIAGQSYDVWGISDGVKVYLYINGNLDNSATYNQSFGTAVGQPFTIGTNAVSGSVTASQSYLGTIERVLFYAKALSASQVFDLYQQPYSFIAQSPPRVTTLIPQQSGLTAGGPGITAKKPGAWAKLDHSHWAGKPAGCWLFNEGGGIVAHDISPNSDSGTLNGGYTWTPTGLQLNGTSGYVNAGDQPQFRFASGQGFSLLCWVTVPTTSNLSLLPGLIEKGIGDAGSTTQPWYLLRVLSGGTVEFNLRSTGGINTVVDSTATVNDGKQHFIAAIADPLSSKLWLYIDNKPPTSVSWTTPDSYGTNGQPLLLGNTQGSRYLPGTLNDVRVYGFGLNASQVFELYQRPYDFIAKPLPKVTTLIPQQSGLVAGGPRITGKKPIPSSELVYDHDYWDELGVPQPTLFLPLLTPGPSGGAKDYSFNGINGTANLLNWETTNYGLGLRCNAGGNAGLTGSGNVVLAQNCTVILEVIVRAFTSSSNAAYFHDNLSSGTGLQIYDNGSTFVVRNETAATSYTITSSQPVTLGNKYQVIFVANGINGYLYLNGQLVGTGTNPNSFSGVRGGTIYQLLGQGGGAFPSTNATLLSATVLPSALSQAQIATIYANPWGMFAPPQPKAKFFALTGGGGNTYNDTGSGGVLLNGSGTVNADYSITGSSGVLLNGSGIVNADYSITGSSGVLLNGSGYQTYNQTGSSGVLLNGSAVVNADYSVTGSSGVLLNGSGYQTYNQTGSSGVLLNGSATVNADYSVTGSSGVLLNGSDTVNADYFVTGASGVLLNGSASGINNNFTETGSGGVLLNGSAGINADYSITGSSGVLLNGTSTPNADYSITGSSGVLLNGSVGVNGDYSITGSSGVLLNGSVGVNGDYSITGSSGVLLNGSVGVNGDYSITGSSGILLNGSAPVNGDYSITGSSGILLNGSAPVNGDYSITGSSGVLLNGSAPVNGDYSITGSSGILLNGSASVGATYSNIGLSGVLIAGISSGDSYFDSGSGGVLLAGTIIISQFATYNETSVGGVRVGGGSVVSTGFYDRFSDPTLNFAVGDWVYVKSDPGPLSAYGNKRTRILSIYILETKVRYLTELGEYDDYQLLSDGQQQSLLEQEKAAYYQEVQDQISRIINTTE